LLITKIFFVPLAEKLLRKFPCGDGKFADTSEKYDSGDGVCNI